MSKLKLVQRMIAVALVLFFLPGIDLVAQSRAEAANLDAGLRELVRMRNAAIASGQREINLKNLEQTLRQKQGARATGVFRLHVDLANRVMANIHLSGRETLDKVQQELKGAGATVVAASSTYRNGVISAFVPPAVIEELARAPGVRAILLARGPIMNAGKVTSQAASVLRSKIANKAGFDGRGVTVGIISDTFNTSGLKDTALVDVLNGDLPYNTTIPGGEGLKFLIEADPRLFGPGTDEGRAMAQLVHDIAPAADLCFATVVVSEVDFAENIRTLRTNPACGADVIVDDAVYTEEPFFSDGIVAQAVDEVAGSDDIPGQKVAYFSSAGNEASAGYASALRVIPDGTARSMSPASVGVNLNTIPKEIDTTGGFHNFDPNGGTVIVQDIFFSDLTDFSFQWDDPFDADPSGITTDLNVLFFDPATGNFVSGVLGGTDDNFQTNQPLEEFQLQATNPGDTGELLMVIARTGKGSHRAKRIKYVSFGSVVDSNGLITAQTPTTFGHASARGANGVAAVVYNTNPAFFGPPKFRQEYEFFSSPGPATIVFDKRGRRLAHPETRLKPDIAAPDGTNTSFFGFDYEAEFGAPDGFPNFFGTSASAPNAAGVAALLIQKRGGPGSVHPREVSRILKRSAPPRDVDISISSAVGQLHDAAVAIVANGDEFSSASNTFFEVGFDSKMPHQTLDTLTINLSAAGLLFNPNVPFTVGSTTGPKVLSVTPDHEISSKITIRFSGFTSGNRVAFGENRDFVNATGGSASNGNSADHLAGASFKAVLSPVHGYKNSQSHVVRGKFKNELGKGYQIYDGFGMIDALNALE